MSRSFSWLLLALLVAGCASAPRVAVPRPMPPPPPMTAPAPVTLGWTEAPVEAGTWRYARDDTGSTASFAPAGGASLLRLRCETETRLVSIIRPDGAAGAGAMTITTSYAARTVPMISGGVVQLQARDPLLDQLAFSRARFAIEAPGLPRLILPAWAEPTRVIEDCRG